MSRIPFSFRTPSAALLLDRAGADDGFILVVVAGTVAAHLVAGNADRSCPGCSVYPVALGAVLRPRLGDLIIFDHDVARARPDVKAIAGPVVAVIQHFVLTKDV